MNTVSGCSRVVLQQSKPKQDSPVQSVVHDSFWMACPSQGSPPLSGAGLVQLRVRFWKPRPQRLLHTDHSVHVDQPPFTVAAEVGDQYMNPYKQHLVFLHFLLVHILLLKTDCRKASATTLEMCLRLFSCEKTDQESISLPCLPRTD